MELAAQGLCGLDADVHELLQAALVVGPAPGQAHQLVAALADGRAIFYTITAHQKFKPARAKFSRLADRPGGHATLLGPGAVGVPRYHELGQQRPCRRAGGEGGEPPFQGTLLGTRRHRPMGMGPPTFHSEFELLRTKAGVDLHRLASQHIAWCGSIGTDQFHPRRLPK